jgi:hypothetical protein
VSDTAIDILEMLRDVGFDSPATAERARAVLIDAKLTTAHKTRIDGAKRVKVEELLRARFLVSCGAAACQGKDSGVEVVIAHDRARCWLCGGSNNARAVQVADETFKRHNIRRVVIVGGSPAVHDQLRQLAPASLELRLINGTDRRTADQARGDRKWADLVIIWGSSELDHKVSTLYTPAGESRSNIVIVNKRGVAALLDQAAIFVSSRDRK